MADELHGRRALARFTAKREQIAYNALFHDKYVERLARHRPQRGGTKND